MPSFFSSTATERLISDISSQVLWHIHSRVNLKKGVKDTLNGLDRGEIHTLDTLLNVFFVISYREFEKSFVCFGENLEVKSTKRCKTAYPIAWFNFWPIYSGVIVEPCGAPKPAINNRCTSRAWLGLVRIGNNVHRDFWNAWRIVLINMIGRGNSAIGGIGNSQAVQVFIKRALWVK